MIRHHRLVSLASLLAVGAALLAATPARAQDAGVIGGTLAPTDFFIGVQRQNGINLTDFEVERFFNIANCKCNTPVFLFVTLLPSGFAKRGTLTGMTGTVEFWIGSDCANPNSRVLGRCDRVFGEQLATFLANGHETVMTDAQTMSTNAALTTTVDVDGGTTGSTFPNTSCTSDTQTFGQTIWVLVDFGADGIIDVSSTRAVNVRLVPPPGPAAVSLQPGNQALVANWTQVDTALFPDLQGYQILCQRGPGLQVFADGTFPSAIQTCPATETGTGVEALDPLFTCSPLLTRLTTSFRVGILQDGITYGVAVVSVDISGNASDPVILYDTPIRTKSFYDVYRAPFDGNPSTNPEPGKAGGGLCAVSPTAGGSMGRSLASALALAGVAAAIAVVRRRRRR